MGDLTKNFSRSEFACKCGCGFDDINIKIVNIAQTLREWLQEPLYVNSGCRCPSWNKKVGSGSLNHIHGNAIDLSCKSGHILMWEMAERLYNTGRLPYLRLALLENSWLHIDCDRPRNNGVFQKL